ncbi:LPXTG cell wall anchor domain-containing protein [Aquihabitans sp. G128]|uniref:LPXTG cell wall anchor domain-containing protein n=1 Tax=Aquihabitans sp. G128 TaxID=2849779 RepID=UPI001C21F990|nr:LPXTG cell wall anchor domain-containing protein [Aquihabitans sp. G128]QXC61977.1 LPXTG cell wall anchor domain-containing protein [Aquihabitans sp. G128]
MRARLIGPFLMVALGAALLVGPAQGSAIDVGSSSPCTTTTQGPVAGVVNPDPCSTTTTTGCPVPNQGAIIVDPCTTTTTTCGLTQGVVIVDPCSTTTTVDPCGPTIGVVSPCTTTSIAETTTTAVGETTTTEDSGVGGEQETSTTTPAVAPAAVNRGELPRTGSDNLPLTAAAIGLIVLGLGLAVAERRHQVARNQS